MALPRAQIAVNCTDCGEDVIESERPAVRWCHFCRLPMHGECAMVVKSGDDACEACHDRLGTVFQMKMAKGNGEKVEDLALETAWDLEINAVKASEEEAALAPYPSPEEDK